jgi:hypothetical protein
LQKMGGAICFLELPAFTIIFAPALMILHKDAYQERLRDMAR